MVSEAGENPDDEAAEHAEKHEHKDQFPERWDAWRRGHGLNIRKDLCELNHNTRGVSEASKPRNAAAMKLDLTLLKTLR